MKKILPLILLLFSLSANAQIVNIPDPVFKNTLVDSGSSTYPYSHVAKNSSGQYFSVDTNNDGEIQVSEAQAVWELYLNFNEINISSLEGISAFINLRKLYCQGNSLTTLSLSTLINLKYLDFSYNDISSIDLSGLTNLETLKCNHTLLTTLDLHECTTLKRVECINSNQVVPLTSINLSGLTQLEYLDVSNNSLTSLNVTGLQNLETLICYFNDITQLDVTTCTGLVNLNCNYNELTTLAISNSPDLQSLDCGRNNITSLSISNVPNLQYVICDHNDLTSINFQDLPTLLQLDCSDNNISNFVLANAPTLEGLNISSTNITALDLTNLPALKTMTCVYGNLEILNLSGLALLEQIDCIGNELVTLNVSGCSSLRKIDAEYNALESLDLSECSSLETLYLHGNPLTYVNLKNGAPEPIAITMYFDEFIYPEETNILICSDEEDIEFYSSIITANPDVDVNILINSYCSFEPNGDYNTINGIVTFDDNENGCGTGDSAQPFIKVHINDGDEQGLGMTNFGGNYNFYTEAGSFTLTPQFENDWFTATPASAEITFLDNNNNTQTQNFCIAPNGVHPDLEVVIIPVGAAQPGFDAMYQIVYRNKGNQTLSGDITFTYNDSVLDYVSAAPVESSSAAGSLIWNYTNLLPFDSGEIFITLNLNGPMETPALEIGDQLDFGTAITPLSGDETPQDNGFTLEQTITGSFDPNDITCLEGDTATPDKIGEYLHYNINFENTGNAAATFIVIEDIINEEQFDVNTLQLMYASHDVEVRVQDNKAEFFFDDIQLDPLEKGNVVFKIKTKNTLQVNDDVTQQANIYFDYNWPIETNEATTIFQVLSTGDYALDSSVRLYPNPATDFVNITAETNIRSLQVYDVQGRLLQAVSPDDNTAKLDISERAEGMYFIKIMTEAGVKVEKIVKK